MTIDRRSLLGLLGAGAVVPLDTAAAAPPAIAFTHGVASGDPTPTGAVLWTRVTPGDPARSAAIPVAWEVRDGGRVVASGHSEARAARDWTVKVDPTTLAPGHDYTYSFAVGEQRSPEGRFRTLPVGTTADVVLAVVSCQLYPGGLFNAYDAIARLPRLDAIVHLGDYIYEYGMTGYGGEIGRKLGRNVEPDHEILTLADYRTRHALYKRDPDLQAAHARAAMIAVWDDHETANDSWTDGAENHQPATEGDWRARKAAAMQAYFEWMPIRDPAPGQPWEAINRSFQFGDLASLVMVETRLLARSHQAVYTDGSGRAPDAAVFAATLAERNRDDRELLGTAQRAWVERELARSVAAGRPWQVLGNQVVMAKIAGPDVEAALGEQAKALPAASLARLRVAQASFKAGLPYNTDSWDGYPAARERLYAAFRRAGSRPLVLSGDSHAFWANQLADAGGVAVAAEFGTSAITSPSIGDSLPGVPVGELLEKANDEVLFCDQRAKGYVLLTLTPETARGEYRAMSTILAKPYEERTIAVYEVRAGDPTAAMRRVGAGEGNIG